MDWLCCGDWGKRHWIVSQVGGREHSHLLTWRLQHRLRRLNLNRQNLVRRVKHFLHKDYSDIVNNIDKQNIKIVLEAVTAAGCMNFLLVHTLKSLFQGHSLVQRYFSIYKLRHLYRWSWAQDWWPPINSQICDGISRSRRSNLDWNAFPRKESVQI
jgi:hypothetical protein